MLQMLGIKGQKRQQGNELMCMISCQKRAKMILYYAVLEMAMLMLVLGDICRKMTI